MCNINFKNIWSGSASDNYFDTNSHSLAKMFINRKTISCLIKIQHDCNMSAQTYNKICFSWDRKAKKKSAEKFVPRHIRKWNINVQKRRLFVFCHVLLINYFAILIYVNNNNFNSPTIMYRGISCIMKWLGNKEYFSICSVCCYNKI